MWVRSVRKRDVLSQIRLATPLAPRSVRAKALGLDSYSERDAVAIGFQHSSRSWIGQGVRAGEGLQVDEVEAASPSGRLTTSCSRGRWWNGGAVLAYAQAHPGELASPPPPAQCAVVRARTVPLIHSAA